MRSSQQKLSRSYVLKASGKVLIVSGVSFFIIFFALTLV